MITVELWDRQKLQDQEEFIGRTKGDGAPLSGGGEFDEPDFRATKDGARPSEWVAARHLQSGARPRRR